MLPDDRLIVAFVDVLRAGETFTSWPLHITIVPWFRNALLSERIAQEIEETLRGICSFVVAVDGTAHFGKDGRKTVELLEQPSPLDEIERRVRAYLKEQGSWLVDETTKLKRPYRPHVTRQGQARLHQGEAVTVRHLALVVQNGGHKTIEYFIRMDKSS